MKSIISSGREGQAVPSRFKGPVWRIPLFHIVQ